MIDRPDIIQTQLQLTAAIHVTIPRAEIRNVMGPGLRELYTAMGKQGIAPTGPWLCYHFKMKPDIFDFEIAVPVAEKVADEGRVYASALPAVTAARTIYRGPYEGLGGAWGEFDAWIRENGHKPAPDLWECYLSGPDATPDSSKWRTELTRPLAGS